MLSTPEPQIRALIRLLSDEDERIARTIAGKLAEIGALEVRDRLGRKASSEEIVKTISRYLFVEQGFAGNTSQYYDVDNSYLNKVLERKTGIPISLSVAYLLVGKRLELPVFGVGMPGH